MTTTPARPSDLTAAAAAAPGGEGLAEFLSAYYDGVTAEDLGERGPQEVLHLARQHRDTAARRAPGSAVVHVTAHPDGTTAVDAVTDDMPFLVDSLTAAVTRRDGSVRLVLHPQLPVRRDETGLLEQVPAPGAPVESWIHLELEGDADPAGLGNDLQRVLADVRAAVQDWPQMRAAALESVEALAAARDADEVRALLRWLAEDHFTFLGMVDLRATPDGLESVPGSGAGLLRPERTEQSTAALAREVCDRAPSRGLLTLTKAGVRSSVHRPAHVDVVAVQVLDATGAVVGERRFVGLLGSSAYTESVRRIPVVRRTVDEALDLSGYTRESYNGRDLFTILETFPRDELFQTDAEDLARIGTSVLRLRERRQLRLFLRRDETGRWMSALVYLPRDRYTTRVRLAVQEELTRTFGASSIDYTARVTESVLARLHFVVRVDAPAVLPDVDVPALEARLAAIARSWVDDLTELATAELGRDEAARLLSMYGDAFPEAYKEDFPAVAGLVDLQRLDALRAGDPLQMCTYAAPGEGPDQRRLKLFCDGPLSLSAVLPLLQSLGVDVLDERPYELECGDGCSRWVYDFGLRYRAPARPPQGGADPLLEEAFEAVWSGRAEDDGFQALVTRARLSWRQVVVLRAYAKYLRQATPTYSSDYVQDVLAGNVEVARLLVRLFEALFDPAQASEEAGRDIAAQVEQALDAVESLDQDRILRALLALVLATDRTSNWQPDPDGRPKPYLVLKLDPQRVPGLPLPRPRHEVFVYSPRFEGVHLRFGAVARGGLRWSDRRDDVRTEVLGLVKAQMVKNAVIVPTGAKGGFVGKRLPDPAVDRAAWLAEGIACYRGFISGLLDVTDDLVDGRVVPPEQVVRRDGDDTYLVVAADKGTATFSDLANEIALERGFWLGDAFASGGSAGYDHKAMGITARGAWESVKRHFRELGVDTQTEPVTVVGIGDMSGDVFGNGMLLSQSLRLVAAFDHRHVFLDPDPDPVVSYEERRRLFELPRSSWADYDPALLSPGGGVHPRSAKSVPVTPQVRARLGLADDVVALTPQELIRAVLLAPVDLLWNGGIGTYVKATSETHAQVGDKANDAIRVDGRTLRARVVGEGGNLGLTQLGRIEYALSGGRLNTDAIDNSAGVDTSDHEVNFKVLLQQAVREGALSPADRDALLAELTDEVARLVLRHDYGQNLALGIARAQAPTMLPVHARFMAHLEARGQLDRALEFLPGPAAVEERAAAGLGLTSSELSVLLAYAKITLKAQLLESALPEQEWFRRALRGYFPAELVARAGDRLEAHPLRREIITTAVVNDVVDRAGSTFAFRAAEETGARPAEVVRAYTVAREVFDVEDLWAEVEALDGVVPTAAQTLVLFEARRLLDRSTRWLLQARRSSIDVATEVERFRGAVSGLVPRLPELLVGVEAQRLARRTADLAAAGLPEPLAARTAGLLDAFSLLDVVEIAAGGRSVDEVARVYFALSDRFEIDRVLTTISGLPRADRWQSLARSALRYDLYAALAGLTSDVLRGAVPGEAPQEAIARWEQTNDEGLTRARSTLQEVVAADRSDLATMSVALRTIRTLLPG